MLRATFAETDIDAKIVEAIHAPAKTAVEWATYYQSGILSELKLLSDRSLFELLSLLVLSLCRQTQIEHLVPGPATCERMLLASLPENPK